MGERQEVNQVKVPNSFLEAVAGTVDWEYFFRQAKVQYLENPNENVDVVVFGHTHVPSYCAMDNGKYYINEGTWIDHNADYPEATRIFAVITTGEQTTAGLYRYEENGSVTDIAASVSEEKGEAASPENPFAYVSFDYKSVENYGDENTQARYVTVSGLATVRYRKIESRTKRLLPCTGFLLPKKIPLTILCLSLKLWRRIC
jgi:hypothetical protein